jgi:hypothetical protein
MLGGHFQRRVEKLGEEIRDGEYMRRIEDFKTRLEPAMLISEEEKRRKDSMT